MSWPAASSIHVKSHPCLIQFTDSIVASQFLRGLAGSNHPPWRQGPEPHLLHRSILIPTGLLIAARLQVGVGFWGEFRNEANWYPRPARDGVWVAVWDAPRNTLQNGAAAPFFAIIRGLADQVAWLGGYVTIGSGAHHPSVARNPPCVAMLLVDLF